MCNLACLGRPSLVFPWRSFWQKVFLKVLSLQLCEMSTPPVDYRSSSSFLLENLTKRLILEGLFSERYFFENRHQRGSKFLWAFFWPPNEESKCSKIISHSKKSYIEPPLPRSYLHFIAKVLTNFVRWIFNEKSYPSRCLGWHQYWICGCGRTPLVCLYTQGKGRFSLMISLINDPTRFPYLLFKKHLMKALDQKKMIL